MNTLSDAGGAFRASLLRNNRQIREERAEAIAEDASVTYRRAVEDLEMELRRLRREQENRIDLSPADANSLVPAAEFEATAYVETDLDLAVQIRNTEIKRDLAAARYSYLFGQPEETNTDNDETTKGE